MALTDHHPQTEPVPTDDDGAGIACCDLCGRSDDHHHELVEYGFADEGRLNPDEEAALNDEDAWAAVDPDVADAPGYDDRAEWIDAKGHVPGPLPLADRRMAQEAAWDDFVHAQRANDHRRGMSFEDEAAECAAAMREHVANHGGPGRL